MKEASHDPGCDALDVDPSIGRSTKPCNCRNRSAKAEADVKTCATCGHTWTEDTMWCSACRRRKIAELEAERDETAPSCQAWWEPRIECVLIAGHPGEHRFSPPNTPDGWALPEPEPDIGEPKAEAWTGDPLWSESSRAQLHAVADRIVEAVHPPRIAEPERGSREYRRIHGPACGCPRCRGDEDEPVQATEDDFVEVLERDLDRVKVLLGLDPVHDGIAQMITLLEKRPEAERSTIVAFARDFARRMSVQSGERSVGAAEAVYILADAVEKGVHLATDEKGEG